MQPVRLSFVFYDIKSKRILHRHSCNVYMPPPHDLKRFIRVGYFIPLNGPLNGHPPSST